MISRLAPATIEATARPLSRFGVACGPRFFQGFLVGLVWIVPALADARFIYALLLWDALLIVAWFADVRRVPAASHLLVRRSWPAPPALSVRSSVRLELTSDARLPVRVQLVDTVPHQMRSSPPTIQATVAPRDELHFDYEIEPRERGDTPIGDVYLRYRSAWGIAERWARAELAQTVLTYPNLEEARRESAFLVRSRQVDIERRTRRSRGAGRFFESLREHQPGDELRDICWTATARRGKLVTRLYQVEQSQPIWIAIDSGRLMRARVDAVTKLDIAVNGALSVARVASASGDRVGLLTYGRQITHRLAPGRGASHQRDIVESLARVRGEEWEANHGHAAARLALDQRRRSLVIWITDVPDVALTPDVIAAASQLTARHLVLFVVIAHHELHRVAGRRPTTVDEMYETAAANEMMARRDLLLNRLEARGALTLEVTRNLSLSLVNAYLEVKQQNRL